MSRLFTVSPAEHARAAAHHAEAQRRLALPPVCSPPPPGYVRAHFHAHLHTVHDRAPPALAADVPLTRGGGLDLREVKRRWGLDSVLPVDPLRWTPVYPTKEDYLSPVAVRVLSEGQGCIMFIEPSVSHQTRMQRHTRLVVIEIFSLLYAILARLIGALAECLGDTPLPALARRLRARARRAKEDHYDGEWNWTWADTQDFAILFMWLALALAWTQGYVQLAPRERARKWVRTGSFALS